jgi:hypothetical protein
MLVKLKKQKLIPTILLTFLYLCVDTIIQSVASVLYLGIWWRVTTLSFFTKLIIQNRHYPLFLYFVLILNCLILFVLIPSISFKVNQTIQKNDFKKYPVTPLFLAAMAVLGVLMMVFFFALIIFAYALPRVFVV